ncbi:hypothetical protein JCM6292_3132 [Bacteroides pyogenes JCM 6292]|uniref:Uncharacterized protein n=2 Tax=Bacteroides pyogenes TaxID=310300 RepID=W4PJP2_9BACE|nr:hypothetical protein JCM6292_3132 [Bacteroides pyogenes JCM 6292]GAE19992.1 hypothetical protein JCM6294_3119 [Bacteroides pyogenes DSM 20611 = JCM 6294]
MKFPILLHADLYNHRKLKGLSPMYKSAFFCFRHTESPYFRCFTGFVPSVLKVVLCAGKT